MDKKKTVIVGSSPNKGRYAWLAAQMLTEYGHPIVPLGIRKGEVVGEKILDIRTKPAIEGVDTITLYLSPANQKEWYPYLASLKPKRIIFNPGTENPEFARFARENGIAPLEACTLVLLRSNQF
jgi:predicted CoA-binding protein